jgi:hypothetical protein
MEPQRLYVNGINGATGGYLLDPVTPQEVLRAALHEQTDPFHLRVLQAKWRQESQPSFAPMEGLNPFNLAEVGWGVVFPCGADPAVKDALRPLLEHRQRAAGRYFKDYSGPDAYRQETPDSSGETALSFLSRHGAGPGPADPQNVPYYLLLVGNPTDIPYEFQYQMDVQYAVGRLWFETPEEYARYAASVVEAETRPPPRPPRAVFFGVRNPDDLATQQSADLLVAPLQLALAADFSNWAAPPVLAADATRERLSRLLGGAETPALLFTASHGMGFPLGDVRQLTDQGALLCQDWPGPDAWGRRGIPPEHYFAAADVPDAADVRGLVAFHFACYGAGTPLLDDYPHPELDGRPRVAPHAFLARLPQRLLAHPRGGALAVVGHVERGWPCSFVWKQAGPQLQVFRSALRRLLKGYPIGSALDVFNVRYAELSTYLKDMLEDARYGKELDADQLAGLWTANHDARGYIIIGDPAVRLTWTR